MQLPELDILTPREREVLTLIAEGRSLLDIAQLLHRSLKTVESHRLSLGRKLNASNRVELAKIAIAHGLISLPGTEAISLSEAQLSQQVRRKEIRNDPVAQKWADEISDRIYDRAGAEYLNALACALCDLVGVQRAGICVPEKDENGGRFRSLAYSNSGVIGDQFSHEVANSPSEVVMDRGCYLAEQGVAIEFPDDEPLSRFAAEAYAGVCLRDRQDAAIGVLWLIDQQPLTQGASIINLLEHFAPRVAPVVVDIARTRSALRLCEQSGEELDRANYQLRQRNKQLDELARFYSELADRMIDGLVVLDETWHITYANEKYAQIVQIEQDSLIGQVVHELMTEESQATFLAMEAERKTDQMHRYKARFRLPDGGTRQVMISPRTLYDEEGQYSGAFAVITDLDELKNVNNH